MAIKYKMVWALFHSIEKWWKFSDLHKANLKQNWNVLAKDGDEVLWFIT